MTAATSSITVRYYLSCGSVDMRKGVYSLYQIIKSELKRNPQSGEVFIFFGKNRRCIKLLVLENDGFLLYHKKLLTGAYVMPLNTTFKGYYSIEWRTFILIFRHFDKLNDSSTGSLTATGSITMLEGVGMRSAKPRSGFDSGLNGSQSNI